MASIHPLGKDACVVAVGATTRLSFLRGALEMMLDPPPGVTKARVPLMLGRDHEAGEMTLSRTGRTLQVRLYDPPRLFLAAAKDARGFLAGEKGILPLADVTDNDTGDPSRAPRAAAPERAPPTRAVTLPPPRAGPAPSLDEVRRAIHACPDGLTCRPGRGVLYPIGAQGRARDGRADILLLGWNPRTSWTARGERGGYSEWRAENEAALAMHAQARDGWARAVAPLLPPGRSLQDDGVMRTFVWKWPTRLKAVGEAPDVYAQRCASSHLWDELAALRPRAVLTYETAAAEWLAAEAAARGMDVTPPAPALRQSEILGWSAASDAWGWSMGLALVKNAPEGGYDRNTIRWANAVFDRILPAGD